MAAIGFKLKAIQAALSLKSIRLKAMASGLRLKAIKAICLHLKGLLPYTQGLKLKLKP